MIPFNKPFISGLEIDNVNDAIATGRLAAPGKYSLLCEEFFRTKYGFQKTFLTSSCTSALEMSALLLQIRPGDEVIMPAYTYVSTANAFILRGAKIVFADSSPLSPHIETSQIERLITGNTRGVVVVHYGGIPCDMDPILALVAKYKLFLVEDAAPAIDVKYKGKAAGSFGDMAAFSFHETKNITSGEGGLLVVNNKKFIDRAEILREKGTNRMDFLRGKTLQYQWMDIGSSFAPSEIVAAFLYAQLGKLSTIQDHRILLTKRYRQNLKQLHDEGRIRIPVVPEYASENGHTMYFLCKDMNERNALIAFLKTKNIHAAFHYLALHSSPYYADKHDGRRLPNADRYTACLLRLPMYFDLSIGDVDAVCTAVKSFYS